MSKWERMVIEALLEARGFDLMDVLVDGTHIDQNGLTIAYSASRTRKKGMVGGRFRRRIIFLPFHSRSHGKTITI